MFTSSFNFQLVILGIIIFGLFWFLFIKTTKLKFYKIKPKLVQTDQFQFDSVILY
jgi:hypothetical protein